MNAKNGWYNNFLKITNKLQIIFLYLFNYSNYLFLNRQKTFIILYKIIYYLIKSKIIQSYKKLYIFHQFIKHVICKNRKIIRFTIKSQRCESKNYKYTSIAIVY